MNDNERLEATRDKIRSNGYKPTARESGVPETTIRRFVKGRDILYRSTVALIKWAFPVQSTRIEAAGLLAGSVGVHDPVYRLVYADQGVEDEVFWIEGEPDDTRKGAIEAFKLRSRNWTCKLFMEIADHLTPDAITRTPEPKGRWISEEETFTLLRVSINRMMTSGKNADWDAFDDAASAALEGLEHLRAAPREKCAP